MVERQISWAVILETVFQRIFPYKITADHGKKNRPAFLQKGKKVPIVRNDLRKRPGFEPTMNFENLDESFCQNLWDLTITVV